MKENLVVLYDGQCNLCVNTVNVLRKLGTTANLEYIDLQQADVSAIVPNVDQSQLLAQLHVVEAEGQLFRGADAIVRIMRTIPQLRWISFIYRIPGLKPLADVLYRIIAKHRYRLFGRKDECESGVCKLPDRHS